MFILLVFSLLALGYEQFKGVTLHRELIQKFLLPSKTPEQIMIRIKNLTHRGGSSAIKVSSVVDFLW